MQKKAGPRSGSTLDDRVVFFQEFLKNPRQIGSITPSSRFLERRIVQIAEVASARLVVELGAGTGGTTRAILNALRPDAKLLVVEVNPHFAALVGRIDDPRLIVHYGSARDLRDALSRYGLPAPDAVISGIPFSTIERRTGSLVLETISSVLAPGGRFVAYQSRRHVDDLSRPHLGPAHVELAWLNIPPLRLYWWEKRATRSAVEEDRSPAALPAESLALVSARADNAADASFRPRLKPR
jgi:phosphatidylethanolamine/phosphatidyl-N-methylethanolamine N-methyltransferase